MPRFASFALAAAAFAMTAATHAHETIPADWCPRGQTPVIVSQFSFSPGWLTQYRTDNEPRRNDDCAERTCGIIDEWFWAQEAAAAHCGASGLRAPVPMDAIPFVSSPLTFNHSEHHTRYRFENGPLVGRCVACVRSDAPVPMPAPVDR